MVGIRIREIRKSKNITQKELSKRTGISVSYIQQLEYKTKENPSLEILTLIANALGVRVSDLAEEGEKRSDEDSRHSTYSSMGANTNIEYHNAKIKEQLKELIVSFSRDIVCEPLEEGKLPFLVDDCYKYIEFLFYKQRI